MSLRARLILTGGLVLLIGFFAANNFVPREGREQTAWLPDQGLRLGLDLRGGVHLVIGVKLDEALEREVVTLRGLLEEQLEDEGIRGVELRAEGTRLILEGGAESARQKARDVLAGRDDLDVAEATDDRVELEFSDQARQGIRQRDMEQVLEVLRTRVSDPAKGIAESVVTRQGSDRVLVQAPGGDAEREALKKILAVTGLLEFKIVKDQDATDELLRAKHPTGLPPDTEIVFERDKDTGRPVLAYLVDKEPAITGALLADARVDFDRRGRPIVLFTWTADGAQIFGDLTEANIGKGLAIVLDGEVRSAPVIRSRISVRGQIEGRFTSQEASDLAIVLRAGSLAVPVAIEEERTVGPALGADSIRRGVRASVVGLLLVVVFTALYYRRAGLFASVALAANLVLIVGLMSLPELPATLTLPGIAGLVLTVGMAIDANVIIFERIREELRAGKQPRAAVDTGFSKARWTILDANITTLITALVLYEFGTGPIKGFAVTLSIGILTSVFAALVLTRLLFDLYVRGERRVDALSI